MKAAFTNQPSHAEAESLQKHIYFLQVSLIDNALSARLYKMISLKEEWQKGGEIYGQKNAELWPLTHTPSAGPFNHGAGSKYKWPRRLISTSCVTANGFLSCIDFKKEPTEKRTCFDTDEAENRQRYLDKFNQKCKDTFLSFIEILRLTVSQEDLL